MSGMRSSSVVATTAWSARPISHALARRCWYWNVVAFSAARRSPRNSTGFRNSVASHTVSLLQPKVIDDLQLHAHGCASSIARPTTSCHCRTAATCCPPAAPRSRSRSSPSGMHSGYPNTKRAWRSSPTCCAPGPYAPPDLGVAGGWRALPALWQMVPRPRTGNAGCFATPGTAGPFHAVGRRVPGPLVRERADQGPVRF